MQFYGARVPSMNLRSLGRYLTDTRVPRWRRWLVLGGVFYAVLPIDLIPDVLPVVGWLDDLGVLAAVCAFFARDVAQHERAGPELLTANRTSRSAVEQRERLGVK